MGEMHSLYEKARLLPPDSPQYFRLQQEMAKLSKSIKIPNGVDEI